jgi:hypothetical protein
MRGFHVHAKTTAEVPLPTPTPQAPSAGSLILACARAHADAACPATSDLAPPADLEHARLQRAFLAGFELALELVNRRARTEPA